MFKATVIEETPIGIRYEICGFEFMDDDYGDIADHVSDWNEDPVGWLTDMLWDLVA